MLYITEIQGAILVVIIWLLDLQLHSCKSHQDRITTTTASCISVIHDICSCKSHHHMCTNTTAPCISVQEAVVFVIIWWCDLQLHMSCITEIEEAVVVVIII
jgi:hypothetical protein